MNAENPNRQDNPRPMPARALLNAKGAALLIAVVLVASWAMSGAKTDRIALLSKNGVPVAGTIEEVTAVKDNLTMPRIVTFVRYAFRDTAGNRHSGSFRHYASSALDLKTGASIAVLYDAENPSNHAPQHYLNARLDPMRD